MKNSLCARWPRNTRVLTFSPFIAPLLVLLLVSCTPSGTWHLRQEKGRAVWTSESGDWRAEADPARGRLTYLGPRTGPNFLNTPDLPEDSLQFGGHRVWLGPQSDWKPFWPPPPNWERVPAASTNIRDQNILEMESPAGPGNSVALRRTYRWLQPGALECKVSWVEKSGGGRQAIQIFQLADGVIIQARPQPDAQVLRGFVRLPIGPRPTTETIFNWPQQATSTGADVLLRRKSEEEKLGFPTQTLLARWPQGEIRLHPGKIEGINSGEPDNGFNSHVYLGRDAMPKIEIEQLSPRLRPEVPGGRVSHSVIVELLHSKDTTP